MPKSLLVALPEELDFAENIHGIPVHFCGVGKLNAAIGAHHLMMQGVSEIINIGSCGSRIKPVGEIIKIGKVYQDIDGSPICAYGLTPFEEPEHAIVLDPDSEHSCFSTDYFYDHSQISKYSPAYLDRINTCTVFDMELYGMAKVCRKYGINLSAYKWVSDDGDHRDWLENCKQSLSRLLDQGLI